MITLGTRSSPLAMAQVHEVSARLIAELKISSHDITIHAVKTTGDAITERPLSEAGGKGLFTREIDKAQLNGIVRIAVHSAKDMPTVLETGLEIAGYLPREDPRDGLITKYGTPLEKVPIGASFGTASLRRQAMILRARPDLKISLLRGNVGTRLAKIAKGEVDVTLLAMAGLKRLKLDMANCHPLDADEFIPAVGQGAIALVIRSDDEEAHSMVQRIVCPATTAAVNMERSYLARLDGSCRTPIAGYAVVEGDKIHFKGLVLSPDGSQEVAVARSGLWKDAVKLGYEAGEEARVLAAPILDWLK